MKGFRIKPVLMLISLLESDGSIKKLGTEASRSRAEIEEEIVSKLCQTGATNVFY